MKENYYIYVVVSNLHTKKYLENIAIKYNIHNRIKYFFLPQTKKLIGLYQKATCFIYPSLYEGFGLPILEAMACSCPVITSNYGATKEVAANAAYLVNPKSIKSIAKAMKVIATDKILRNKLINLGLQRVKKFSWEKTAWETLKVYNSVYKSK